MLFIGIVYLVFIKQKWVVNFNKKGDNNWINLNRLYFYLKGNDIWIDKVQCY